MTYVTCRLTAKNRDQLRNPTLGNRVWATFNFYSPYRACVCVEDLLQLIRDTENDDLTCALQRFVCTYSDEIAPLAIEVTKHLVRCFSNSRLLFNMPCWRCLHSRSTLADMLSATVHRLFGTSYCYPSDLSTVSTLQISSRNPPVCSPLISTVLLPHSDHPRLRFKPCT